MLFVLPRVTVRSLYKPLSVREFALLGWNESADLILFLFAMSEKKLTISIKLHSDSFLLCSIYCQCDLNEKEKLISLAVAL